MISVAISIPSGRDWKRDFCMSLIDMRDLSVRQSLGLDYEPAQHIHYHASSNICQNRHNLVREAQKRECTHILWLDDDMRFPDDTLIRLLRHSLPFVAANCTTRAVPILPTAVKNGKRLPSVDRSGLEEVDQVGFGVVLCETRIFDAVAKPWFSFEWDPEFPDTYMSEDVYFCRKARASGFKIMIDHDLSNQIGHIGDMEFTHDMTEPQ